MLRQTTNAAFAVFNLPGAEPRQAGAFEDHGGSAEGLPHVR